MAALPPAVGLAPLGGPFSRGFTWGLTRRTDLSEGARGTSEWTGWVRPHRQACRARGRAGHSWAPQAPQAARQSADACSLCMARTRSAPDFLNLRVRTRVFQVSALPGGRAARHQNALCRLRGSSPASGEGGREACGSVLPRGRWQTPWARLSPKAAGWSVTGSELFPVAPSPRFTGEEERSWEKQGPLPRAGVVLGEATLFSVGPRGQNLLFWAQSRPSCCPGAHVTGKDKQVDVSTHSRQRAGRGSMCKGPEAAGPGGDEGTVAGDGAGEVTWPVTEPCGTCSNRREPPGGL